MKHNIKHLAIIMDGNDRWAKSNNLTKAEGHRYGTELIKKLTPEIAQLDISYLTLYAFSSENWQRPKEEVSFLMGLLDRYLENDIQFLHQNQIRLKIIGNLQKLDQKLQSKIHTTVESTKNNSKMTLCIAFSYGGREEIIQACQKIIDSGEKHVSETIFRQYLYDPEMPDVDLFIRPGGVYRTSNYLLWQSPYAELYFTKKFWPDFTIDDIKKAIEDYSTRKRTFGTRPDSE